MILYNIFCADGSVLYVAFQSLASLSIVCIAFDANEIRRIKQAHNVVKQASQGKKTMLFPLDYYSTFCNLQ